MMKKIIFTVVAMVFYFSSVFADNIVIQLAAFNRSVDTELYFSGVGDVQMMRDHNNFYIYYINSETETADAQQLISNYKAMGFNAYEIDINKILDCIIACGSARPATPTYTPAPAIDVTTTPSYEPTPNEPGPYEASEMQDFEKLRVVMMDDPEHFVTIEGNQQLVRKIQCYLNTRGVGNCRIDVNEYWQKIKTGQKATIWLFGDEEVLDVESEFRRIVNERKRKMNSKKGTIFSILEEEVNENQ